MSTAIYLALAAFLLVYVVRAWRDDRWQRRALEAEHKLAVEQRVVIHLRQRLALERALNAMTTRSLRRTDRERRNHLVSLELVLGDAEPTTHLKAARRSPSARSARRKAASA
jgi:hypothetical protein